MDCIFIDPPYNTGNEGWCYNDNVNSPLLKEWLKGNPIGIEDGLRHDKWCAMMYPRLRLLHELLSDEGSFWMTLDDNEVHRAREILDEIFGEDNFIGIAIWEKADSPRMDADFFSVSHDYVVVYAKTKGSVVFQKLGQEDDAPPDHYNLVHENGRQYYLKPLRAMGGQGETRDARPNLYYPLTAPDGTEVFPKLQSGRDGAWRWSREKSIREAVRIEWRGEAGAWTPYYRIYADMNSGRPPETIWYNTDIGSSRTAKAQLKALFDGESPFDTPKPIALIERMLQIAMPHDGVMLDSFAGSGTTAHAVLAQNAKDGGNRKFILVEGEDYADTLTAERVRRVINGYAFTGIQREELLRERLTWSTFSRDNARDRVLAQVQSIENLETSRFDRIKKTVKDGELIVTGEKDVAQRAEGLGGSFTYCTLGAPIELDALLTGQSLPSFDALASVLFHMATNAPFDPQALSVSDDGVGLLGEAAGTCVWLIYQPDLDWLKSKDAALTLARARGFAVHAPDKRHLVFAPARFVSQKLLDTEGLKVEFAPLPFALYRIERA